MIEQTGRRRRKRSHAIFLTGLMVGAAVTITACEAPPAATQWGEPPAAESSQQVDALSFASLEECKSDARLTSQECDEAYAEAQNASATNVPKFGDQQSCEERYGVDQCVPRSSQGGGSFFTPLLTGFLIGQAVNNFGGGYRGAPLYRDRNGAFQTGSGSPVSRDYLTGRTQVGADSFGATSRAKAPTRVQSRTAVVSRGGFGGRGRSFGG